MAGVEGFEPPNAGTKNQCLTTWRHPTKARIIIAQCDASSLVAGEDRQENLQ